MTDERIVEQLVTEYQAGKVTRRDFIQRATLLLGGSGMATALLLAAQGAPFATVARAAGQLEAQATMAATMAATDIETSMIKFKTPTDEAPGYLAKPKGDGPFPAVIVIQEWWGVDDHIKSIADRFARLGYAAVAPDLYRGEVAKEPSDAQRLVMKVQQAQAVADIQGAVDYLIAQKYVEPKKAGVIGFCFGGRVAMNMAWAGKNIGAVATFYGGGINPTQEDINNVTVPVMGFYGDQDNGIPLKTIEDWQAKFKAAGKSYEVTIYKGAPHAFFNDSRPSYNKAAAEDAWPKVLAFFKQHLTDGAMMAATMSATMSATMAATPAATPAR